LFPKNKSLSCSLGQLKLLLPWDMILTWGKTNFLKEQWISPREGPSSLGKHMFQFFLQSQSSHIGFYISLQPIVRKVLRRITTLYLKALQFNLRCKNYDLTNFQTHFFLKGTQFKLFFWAHGCAWRKNSPREQPCSFGKQSKSCSLRSNHIPLIANVFETLYDHNFRIWVIIEVLSTT
jgi:hypothetical protein